MNGESPETPAAGATAYSAQGEPTSELTPSSKISNTTARKSSLIESTIRRYGLLVSIALCITLRVIYNLQHEHLVCQFGDAYYFLAGASKWYEVLATVVHTGNFNLLANLPPVSVNDVLVMRSIGVSDRLMNDGPIYTSFLALVLSILGFPAGSLDFNTIAFKLACSNVLLDAITCSFIFSIAKKCFDLRTALIASFLFAIYPDSIINTQSCYAETFGTAILTAWSWLMLKAFCPSATEKLNPPTYFILGTVTGMVALTRPLFVMLPFAIAIALTAFKLVQKLGNKDLRAAMDNKSILTAVVAVLLGLSVVFVPWFAFTNKVTGRYLLCVNRTPAFNLFLGNQLDRDGWRAYPFPENIPLQVPEAIKQLSARIEQKPAEYASLQIRKIPRLWAGVWNEFQYRLFGLPIGAQEFFHQCLLVFSIGGISLLLSTIGQNRNETNSWV